MPPRDPQAVLEKLGQTTLKVDTFFLRRTGFVSNQTILKLGEYNLNCVPATLGTGEGQFLAVLTPSEISLFSKFTSGTHILILTFDDPDLKDVMRFPLRVGLIALTPVPDRKNVCFVQLKFKSLPAEFILFLGTYLEELEARQLTWESLAVQSLPFDEAAVRFMHAGTEAFLVSGNQKQPAKLLSFQTKLLVLEATGGVEPGRYHLQMRFRDRPLVLEGELDSNGNFSVDFQADWLDLVEDYVFHLNLRHKGESSKGGLG